MTDRCCAHCAYVGRVHNGDPGELICVNCPRAPGELVRVQLDGVCENFLAQRKSSPPATRTLILPTPPNDKIRYIALTKNEFAIVDAADYDELSKYKWVVSGTAGRYYAVRHERGKVIYMHRQIMQPPPGMVTDHISGYRLDNRRENLRNCTRTQNRWNSHERGSSSGFKGVWYSRERRKYAAGVEINGEPIHLGWFDDPVEAAHVRDRKALEVYGPYAYLNLPDDMEPHPIPPDPNHPERPVRMTGPYGYLRCPPYLPPLPDGTWPTYPRLWGAQRVLRLVAWAQNHPTPPTSEIQPPEPRQECHLGRGGEPEPGASSTAEKTEDTEIRTKAASSRKERKRPQR